MPDKAFERIVGYGAVGMRPCRIAASPVKSGETMRRETLFKYARQHYQAEPEYLWRNLPGYAVLRHHDGKKWFAVVMNVPGSKLGLAGEEDIDVLEVKVRPEHIGSLRQKEGILPAYHMNKAHWISIVLAGPLSPEEIYDLLSDSYALTAG